MSFVKSPRTLKLGDFFLQRMLIMLQNNQFGGFPMPKSNYFRLPNCWTDITHDITSLSELKVIEYVLRHTWGFDEYEKPKRITINEFIMGRKKRDGSRMDKGTGLSEPSVIRGLKKAVENGYLEVELDGRDMARKKKFYYLRMAKKNEPSKVKSRPKEVTVSSKEMIVRPKETLVGSKETLDRTEKDTIKKDTLERNLIDNYLSNPPGLDEVTEVFNKSLKNNKPAKKKTKSATPSKFDIRAAKKLHKIVSSYITINCRSKISEWSRHFRLMREYDKVPAPKIKEALLWFEKNIGKLYVPECFSGKSFREDYNDGKIQAAMIREKEDEKRIQKKKNMASGDVYYGDINVRYVQSKYFTKHGFGPANQKQLDEVLVEMGYSPGAVPSSKI